MTRTPKHHPTGPASARGLLIGHLAHTPELHTCADGLVRCSIELDAITASFVQSHSVGPVVATAAVAAEVAGELSRGDEVALVVEVDGQTGHPLGFVVRQFYVPLPLGAGADRPEWPSGHAPGCPIVGGMFRLSHRPAIRTSPRHSPYAGMPVGELVVSKPRPLKPLAVFGRLAGCAANLRAGSDAMVLVDDDPAIDALCVWAIFVRPSEARRIRQKTAA